MISKVCSLGRLAALLLLVAAITSRIASVGSSRVTKPYDCMTEMLI